MDSEQKTKLDDLANTIHFNKQIMDKLQGEYDEAWRQVIDILGPDPFEHEAPTGKLTYRQRGGESQLNERSLLEHIREQYPENWREIWLTITDAASEDDVLLLRTLDQDRLADLMNEQNLDPAQFIEKTKVTYARYAK